MTHQTTVWHVSEFSGEGWRARCSCGWAKSDRMYTRGVARYAAERHVEARGHQVTENMVDMSRWSKEWQRDL